LNSACTSAAGFASIFSAKSLSDAPRASRIVSPLPCGNRTPPTTGACMFSYSARFARLDLRPRRGAPPGRPNAPAAPPR
jgi:hypothetical protein